MKKLISSIVSFVICYVALAQTPQSFSYQAVVRDAGGNVLQSQSVGFKLSIISGSVSGTVVYTETHNVTTNTFGIVTLNVGSGTATYGTFSTINWAVASHFIKVEADPTGGTSYLNMGTTQLLSVPYALNSAKSDYSSVAGTANYVGGTGINVTGSTITNTSPNQTVTLTNGTGISITGSYPAFTVTNSSQNATHTGDVTGSGALTISTNAVTTTKIADGNVTAVKLNSMAATSGQALKFNGTNWAPAADLNSGTPAGLNKAIQFNNAGVFGGNSKLIWDNSNERLGVGTASPLGRMVVQGSATALATEPLFEVKNKAGQTVFVVYEDSVNVFVNDDAIQSNRGGFAVSGRNSSKSFTHNYLKVTPDSTRIFTGDTIAGFGVENIGASSSTSYMRLTPSNYFIGHESGQNIDVAGGGLYNNFFGYETGFSNTTGNSNVFIGYQTGFNNMTGNGNTAFGTQSLFSNISGDDNTAIGYNALLYNQTGQNNVATGGFSLSANTDGSENSAFGYAALYSNTSGGYNTAIGTQSLGSNIIGAENTALGAFALYSNTSGSYNTASGTQSLFSNSVGTENTALGTNTLYSNTSGSYNTAIGTLSLIDNTIGTYNTASGAHSLYSNISGSFNTAIGNESLFKNTSGSDNTAVGSNSLDSNTTGAYNTALGIFSLLQNTSGSYNAAIGTNSLQSNTIGTYNTALGTYSLLGNTTGTYNTALGCSAFQSGAAYTNSTAIGYQAPINASNQVRLGNGAVLTLYCMAAYVGTVGVTNRDLYVDNTGKIGYVASSKRYKNNITNMENVNWLYDLRPVNYTYKNDSTNRKQFGLIAEEVEKLNSLFVSYNPDGTVETVNYSSLISPMLKAIQDLKLENNSLKTKNSEIDNLKVEIEILNKQVEDLTNLVKDIYK